MKKVKEFLKNINNKIKNIWNICIKKFKKLGSTSVITIIIVILIIILFGINTYVTIAQNTDYQKKVQSGNDRWQQVFEIIENIKNEVDTLNNKVNELEQEINKLHK